MKTKKQQNDVREPDMKSLIYQHSQFLDKLIELIPATFYFSKDEEKPWFQGLSKAKKAAAKKESRENIKKARRDRLDPDKASLTTLDLLKQNLDKEKKQEEAEEESDDDDDGEEEEEEEMEINPGLKNDARSATYEELRQRYQRKLQELRGARHTDADDKSNRELKRIKRNEERSSKRKREYGSEVGKKAIIIASKINLAKHVDKVAEEASKELRFSHVKIGDEDDHGRMKKKRKLSKQKELEKAKELQQAKADPEKGAKESWRAATSKAAGVKVHDDPKLLKQSIKKEKKRQQKNAEKWKERVESQHKVKAGKQEKRSHNIAERIQEKKARRIAKREKKLMRPGFEGRREGYVNETTST